MQFYAILLANNFNFESNNKKRIYNKFIYTFLKIIS